MPEPSDETQPPPLNGVETVGDAVDRNETVDDERRRGLRISGPPARIARYEVLSELGRGGMGIVYAAREPRLERKVAIKVLVHGAGSPRAIERFEIEARLAARLRHPNIVGVHEVGSDGDQQFIVMDLIPGRSLCELIRAEGRLAPRRAARVMERTARALSYAHQNFVLHRDMKPGNIIVGEGDEPVITDFGLAKDVGDTSTPRSPTISGQAVGTPAYMSPEQARGEHVLVDRRSDVYSLGATLYETLTGKQPFEGSFLEVLQQLGRVDPIKPSKLRPDLDRDLEVICLKCLAPEPEQRYQTAEALAEDLDRYLDDEPISAHAPSALQRARRWLRRHERFARGVGAASAIGAGFLLVTTTAFVVQVRREHSATEAALARAQRAEKAATAAADEAERQALLAQEREEIARSSLTLVVREVHEKLRSIPGERVRAVRKNLVEKALEGLKSIRDAQVAEADELAFDAHMQLGQLQRIAGEAGDARASFEAARRALPSGEAPPGSALEERRRSVLTCLGDAAFADGDLQGASEYFGEVVRLCRRPGSLAADAGAWQLAAGLLNYGSARQGLGHLQESISLFEEGARLLERCLAEHPAHRQDAAHDLAATLGQLGSALHALGRSAEAERAYRQALALDRESYLRTQQSLSSARSLALSLVQLSRCLQSRQRSSEALSSMKEATALARSIAHRDPENSLDARFLCSRLSELASVHLELDDPGLAEEVLDEAERIATRLYELEPGFEHGRLLLGVRGNRGRARLQQGKGEAAAESFAAAVRLCRALYQRAPTDLNCQLQLSASLQDAGRAEKALGHRAEASALFQEAMSVATQLVKQAPQHLEGREALARSLNQLASSALASGRRREAAAHYTRSIELWRGLLGRREERGVRRGLGNALTGLGGLRLTAGHLLEGRELMREALAEWRALLEVPAELTPRSIRESLAETLLGLALAELRLGQPVVAGPQFDEGRALLRAIHAEDAQALRAWRNLAVAGVDQGEQALLVGQPQRALILLDEAKALLEQLPVDPDQGDVRAQIPPLERVARAQSAFVAEGRPAQTADELLGLAYAAYGSEDYALAGKVFQAAFRAGGDRLRFDRSHLYYGALCAALAAKAEGDETMAGLWRKQAAHWLATDIEATRYVLAGHREAAAAATDEPLRREAEQAAQRLVDILSWRQLQEEFSEVRDDPRVQAALQGGD